MLRRNVELNAFGDRVTALEVAAGAREGVAASTGLERVTTRPLAPREPGGSGGESTEVRIRPLHAILEPGTATGSGL